MAGIKIVDLPALGRDLAATDLLELSLAGGTGSRKITGQEIINASKLNVGTTPIINGTAGRLLFQGTGDILQQSGNLFWDNTNGRLGIGTSTAPSGSVYIDNSGNDVKQHLVLKNSDAGSGAQVHLDLHNNVAGSSYSSGASLFLCSSTHATPYASALGFWNYLNGPIALATNSAERMRVAASGNVLIGTTTDAGFRLDVNGTARFTGQFSTGSNINFQICQNSGNANFQVRADGYVQFNNYTPLSGTTLNVLDGSRISMSGGGPLTGNINQFAMAHLFQTNVSSHTYTGVLISPTINQTGGANGITRGLYITPTLTSAADFRAIETTAGNVLFGSNFFWDNTNARLGIGTSTPAYALEVKKSVVGDHGTNIQNTSNSTSARSFFQVSNDTNQYAEFLLNSSTYTGSARFGITGQAAFMDANVTTILGTIGANALIFGTNNIERVRVFGSTGNVGINTTTDAGYRLDVNGTARVNGELRAGNLQILTSGNAGGTGQGIVVTGTDTTFQFNGSGGSAAVDMFQFRNWGGTTATAQPVNVDKSVIRIYGGFNSGNVSNLSGNTLSITPTYNLTGSATIVRGVYYNPTLTSLTNGTHFAFHSTSGRVRFEGLPTSPTGLNAGDIYNDGGILKIV